MSRFCLPFLLLPFTLPVQAGPIHAGGNTSQGEEITCDLPAGEHLRNSTGRDGLGLCVFTSLDHAARWANEPALIGFRDFMKLQPGGGWPEKVDEYIPRMAASKGLPAPPYIQHTGGDAEFLRLALKTGRYVSVTYNGRDGVFYSGNIAHMVNLVHLTDKWAVVHDNNFPGKWLWLPTPDFLSRWRGSGGGWAVVLLKSGPPPIPVNVAGPREVIGQNRCVDGRCRIAEPEARWQVDQQATGYFYLFAGSRQLGTWYPDGRGYRPLRTDGTWGATGEPPVPLPEGALTNFGLDVERVSSESRYWVNGRPTSRGDALAAFGSLIDDSGKLRLTVVGDDALRQRVRDDLARHPALLAYRDRLLVQDYPPDHWAVAGVGMAPGITLQSAPDAAGKAPVLARLPDYAGPEMLIAAIRKADPAYRPEKDPKVTADESRRSLMEKVPSAVWLLAGGVVMWVAKRRKAQ